MVLHKGLFGFSDNPVCNLDLFLTCMFLFKRLHHITPANRFCVCTSSLQTFVKHTTKLKSIHCTSSLTKLKNNCHNDQTKYYIIDLKTIQNSGIERTYETSFVCKTI